MSEKKIKYGDMELEVSEIYPYTYDYGNGKTVLRIFCDSNESYNEKIKPLMNHTGKIEYYEKTEDAADLTLKNEYMNYYADSMCKVTSSGYEIELTRMSETDVMVNELTQTLNDLVLLMAEEMGA